MDILNIEEVIFNLASLLNYKELIHLSSINQSYNLIANQMIKTYHYVNIMKELNINVIMSNYKAFISDKIDIEKFSYRTSHIRVINKSLIINKSNTDDVDDLMKKFGKMVNINISKLKKVQDTVTFFIKINYDKLIGYPCSFKNQKLIVIHNHQFKIYKNGQVSGFIKKFDDFMIAYKLLLVTIKHI